MKHQLHWPGVAHLRLGLAQQRHVLVGVALPILVLLIAGVLLFTQAAFSRPAHAGEERAAAVAPFKGRPTRTPTPTPTSKPGPTPTITVTTDPTRVPTGIVRPGTGSSGPAGPGGEDIQTPEVATDAPPWWGLMVLVGTLLVFSTFIILFTRRQTHQHLSPALISPPQKARQRRLSALSQMLPTRHTPPQGREDVGDSRLEARQTRESVPSPPIKPPRWLIEAGLLKDETGELPAAHEQDG